MNPEELLYAETHEWLHVGEAGSEKIGTLGISAFAVEQLNDVVHMELPEVGTAVAAGDEFGEVESVKAVSPLYSPVAGEVTEVNASLPDNLERLNEDPYGEAWIIKIKITDEGGLGNLLDHTAYQKQISEEG